MKKLKNIYKVLMTGLLLVILGSSCTKELREQEYGKQEKHHGACVVQRAFDIIVALLA